MCVQLVDASFNLAIHMPTRILLRSSSTHEPSDPPLEVVSLFASLIPGCSGRPTRPHRPANLPATQQASKNKGFIGFLWHALAQPRGKGARPREEVNLSTLGVRRASHSVAVASATRRTPATDIPEAGSLVIGERSHLLVFRECGSMMRELRIPHARHRLSPTLTARRCRSLPCYNPGVDSRERQVGPPPRSFSRLGGGTCMASHLLS